MVDGRPASFVLVPLEHREVGHPEERERALVDQPELAAELEAERAEHPRGHRPRVGGEEQRLVGRRGERLELRLGEELRDRRADLALLVADHVGEALGAELLRALLERGELGAREHPRDAEEPHRLGAGEDAELGAARRLASRPRSRARSGCRACRSRTGDPPRRTSSAGTDVGSRSRGTRSRRPRRSPPSARTARRGPGTTSPRRAA